MRYVSVMGSPRPSGAEQSVQALLPRGRVIRHAGLCIALSLVAGRRFLAACPGALLGCHDQLDRGPDSDRCAEAGPGPVLAGSSGQHQLSLGVLAGWGVGARPKVRRTMTVAAVMMAAVSPEVYALAFTAPASCEIRPVRTAGTPMPR